MGTNGECEKKHPCDQDNNGGCERICKKEGAGRSCACPEGFKLAADNKKCEEIHPCDKRGKAGCEHTCNKFENLKFTCSCEPAEDFELHTDGRQCIKSKFDSPIYKWYKGT